jgi:hypothetical protein
MRDSYLISRSWVVDRELGEDVVVVEACEVADCLVIGW